MKIKTLKWLIKRRYHRAFSRLCLVPLAWHRFPLRAGVHFCGFALTAQPAGGSRSVRANPPTTPPPTCAPCTCPTKRPRSTVPASPTHGRYQPRAARPQGTSADPRTRAPGRARSGGHIASLAPSGQTGGLTPVPGPGPTAPGPRGTGGGP